jgi:energy-coupling factor transport system ATP-binding protein
MGLEKREEIFEVSGLHHFYPNGAHALRGVDLKIRAGGFIGLVGQNGSGKTTLVKHLNGLLRPSRGGVRFKGTDCHTLDAAEIASRVGYVFQNPDYQIFLHTVHDELAFGPRNLKLSEEEVRGRVARALTLMDLLGTEAQHPQTLSRGQRQRLAIASVLAMEPEVIVLDEPTGGQDRLQARRLMDLLTDLNRRGHTILLVTHDLELAAEFCDRLLVMGGGTLLLDGPPGEVFRQEEVLRSARLRAPDIYRLCTRLGWDSPALSVEEFVRRREAAEAYGDVEKKEA